MSAHNHPADDDDQDLHEPWEDHYDTPPPCSPELDHLWDEAYFYGEY